MKKSSMRRHDTNPVRIARGHRQRIGRRELKSRTVPAPVHAERKAQRVRENGVLVKKAEVKPGIKKSSNVAANATKNFFS